MSGLQHVLLSMLLALTIYLAFQNQQLHSEIQALNALQQGSSDVMAETLAPLATQMAGINEIVTGLGKEADDKTRQQMTALQQRIALYQVLGSVIQADRLRAAGKGKEAAAKLKSIKKPIWQAGDALPKHKDSLQGLMTTIDKLLKAWDRGDTSTAPDQVRKQLETVLGELAK